MKNRIIFFSGGLSSFAVACHVQQKYPEDNIVLYFTDTLWEDSDLYRFIYEASDKMRLPLLIHRDGDNPMEKMFKEKVIYNSRIGNCSALLKMKVAKDFIKKGKVPSEEEWYNGQYLKAPANTITNDPELYFGIGFDEMHREPKIRENWTPFQVHMPLIDLAIPADEWLSHFDIDMPIAYKQGFAHNNCAGRCVKAGQAHFRLLRESRPEVFQELKAQEHYLKLYVSEYHRIRNPERDGLEDHLDDEVKDYMLKKLDDAYRPYFLEGAKKPGIYVPMSLKINEYAFMKKSLRRKTKPYSLRQLEQDILTEPEQLDLFDFGGCGCFVDESSLHKKEVI